MRVLETILALAGWLVPFFSLGTDSSATGRVAYYNPTLGGGSMLNDAGDGYGEPLNVRSSTSTHVTFLCS